jgi:hypothetical protein
LRIIKPDRYRRFTLEVHIFGSVRAMWMKKAPFDSVKQFLSMVLVKCQHEHYSDLRSLEIKRYHISHNFPEQRKQCIAKAYLSPNINSAPFNISFS